MPVSSYLHIWDLLVICVAMRKRNTNEQIFYIVSMDILQMLVEQLHDARTMQVSWFFKNIFFILLTGVVCTTTTRLRTILTPLSHIVFEWVLMISVYFRMFISWLSSILKKFLQRLAHQEVKGCVAWVHI